MRLDKYLSYALNMTRSEVNPFIKKNEIIVNNKCVKNKDYKINEDIDKVYVNGQLVIYKKFIYYMLNKPSGLVCSTKGFMNETIYSLFEDSKYDLSSIGRLDKDTEGLLIVTNNGSLNHFLTSPSHHIDKKYYCIINEDLNDDEINEMMEGIVIFDGDQEPFKTLPCKVERIKEREYYITIHEGKFHQIKRMFAYFKRDVEYLKRVSFGDVVLDDNLKLGEYRELTDEELNCLKKGFKE